MEFGDLSDLPCLGWSFGFCLFWYFEFVFCLFGVRLMYSDVSGVCDFVVCVNLQFLGELCGVWVGIRRKFAGIWQFARFLTDVEFPELGGF